MFSNDRPLMNRREIFLTSVIIMLQKIKHLRINLKEEISLYTKKSINYYEQK